MSTTFAYAASSSTLLHCNGLNSFRDARLKISARCGKVRVMASPTVSSPKRETDPKKRVVITGMGLVSVFGSDIDTFHNKLLDGVSGITPIHKFDASEFSVRIAGQICDFSSEGYINGKDDRRLDDCWRYCLVAGKRALEDANLGKHVMESLEHAMKRGVKIYAEYLGGATTFDAHHKTEQRPDGLALSSCIVKSLKDAGVAPQEVNYVNAHATGVASADMAEVKAIHKVFSNTSELKMNATKSMIGHAIGAAGGLEAIATIKAINSGWLHPTINQYELEAEVTIDIVPNVKKQHQVNVGISNSLGMGGHNSVVVFAPFNP